MEKNENQSKYSEQIWTETFDNELNKIHKHTHTHIPISSHMQTELMLNL